jgi:hypothetical protein
MQNWAEQREDYSIQEEVLVDDGGRVPTVRSEAWEEMQRTDQAATPATSAWGATYEGPRCYIGKHQG